MTICPGLIDKNTEFFTDPDGHFFGVHGGKTLPFIELPENVRQCVENDMIERATTGFASQKCGSENTIDCIIQHGKCNFGGFSLEADLTENGEMTHEYVECGERGCCPFEGKLCRHVKVQHGFLTPREIVFLKLVAKGLLNKEIATEMSISENTISSYTETIQQKTGLQNKVEMAGLAYRLALI